MKCEKKTKDTDRIDHIEHLLNHTYDKLERAIKDSGEEYRDFQADIEKLEKRITELENKIGLLEYRLNKEATK